MKQKSIKIWNGVNIDKSWQRTYGSQRIENESLSRYLFYFFPKGLNIE